jgi:hypothetical protein
MRSRTKRNIALLMSLLLIGTVVQAQGESCPDIVGAALDATSEQCSTTARNQACYGNIDLAATPQSGVADFHFNAPGDRVAVGDVANLSLSSRVEQDGTWGIALIQLQANLPDTLPGQNVTFLLFGDVEIENGVSTNVEPVTFDVSAQGDINVRSGPSTGDAPVTRLSAGESVTAIARNADTTWLRVSLADGSTGWVSAEVVAADGDMETLDVYDPTAQPLNPMQAFYFRSGLGDAPCAEAPDSGILVQTPEGVEHIQFIVNDVNITLGSTAYLQAQASGDMTASVVEGEAVVAVGGASVNVPAGSQVHVPLDVDGRASGAPSQPEPYDATKMAVLPGRILPRAITVADPIDPDSIISAIIPAAGQWQWTWPVESMGCAANGITVTMLPQAPFQLPGDSFSLEMLLGFVDIFDTTQPGTLTYSQPDPNTYRLDYAFDADHTTYIEVHVIDGDHMEGRKEWTLPGCVYSFAFEVTRIGD